MQSAIEFDLIGISKVQVLFTLTPYGAFRKK